MEQSLKNVRVESGSKFIGMVFLYTFIALAITAITSAVVGLIFSKAVCPIDDYTVQIDYEALKPYIYLLVVSGIMYIPLIIWINIVTFRGRGRVDVPFVLYAIVMGILISSFTMFVPFYLIAISFGITCITFGGLATIGLFSKKNLSFLGMVAGGIFIGALIMSLFNLIWMFVSPATFQAMYWFISYAIFFAMMLITVFDVYRVKQIARNGEQSTNVALYCAFNLYVDFIYLFIRILLIVVRIFGRNR